MRLFGSHPRHGKKRSWLLLFMLAVMGTLIIPPIMTLIQMSIHRWDGLEMGPLSLENFRVVFIDGFQAVVASSLVYALGSSAIALVFGTALAWVVERTDAPHKALTYAVCFVTFAVPGVVKVIGWILLLGPNAGLLNLVFKSLAGVSFNIFSLAGMIMVESIVWIPIVFFLMSASFKSLDPTLEEAAEMCGAKRWDVFARITFRLAWPSVLAALFLSLIRTLESFEVPTLIGIPAGIDVFTTVIYRAVKGKITPAYGVASAYGILLTLLILVCFPAYLKITAQADRYATITGKAYRPRVLKLGRYRPMAGIGVLAVNGLLLLPLLMLLWVSFQRYHGRVTLASLKRLTLDHYRESLSDVTIISAFTNTFLISALAACAVAVLAALTAWLVLRTHYRSRFILDLLVSTPLILPGVVAGIAFLRTYVNFSLLPIYGTVWLLVLAFAVKYLPFGMRYCYSGLVAIHRELEEVALVSGAPLWRSLMLVVAPLMMPAIFSAWVFTFLHSSRELSIAVFLSSPTTSVIAVRILSLWQDGQVTELSAFSIVVVTVMVLASLMLRRLGAARFGQMAS